MEGITPTGNIDYLVELLAGLVEEGRPLTREQIRGHLESLCRAQLAKVVEWVKTTKCGACEDCWGCALLQALRKAAGEGK